VWRLLIALICVGVAGVQAGQQNPSRAVAEADPQSVTASGVVLPAELSNIQIENLALLGRVWGFLKYHHPNVTSGQLQWDHELFRVIPAVVQAKSHADVNALLAEWVDSLGQIAPPQLHAELKEQEPYLRPDVNWIDDKVLLGSDLSSKLQKIYNARTPNKQFYVSLVPQIGNPKFENEPTYERVSLPDAGYQLLALYRFWNIIEYWFPYRDVTGEDWNAVLTHFIPRVGLAKDAQTYQRELLALIAKAHDGHANLWSSLQARPPVGKCQLPMTVRFIESQPIVAKLHTRATSGTDMLEIGDILTELDGIAIGKLIEEWSPYYATSNDAARRRDIARYMTRGECGESKVGVRRGSRKIDFRLQREPAAIADFSLPTHDLVGPAFRLLPGKEVAYLKLSAVKAAECEGYVEQASGTKGMIIDIRNYPSEFVVFALGGLLVEKQTPFARFTVGDLSNPGAFHWTEPVSLDAETPHYSGKVVILVDESSMSQSEYTAMAFRSAKGSIVVGSTTSGADGNVSPIPMPGSLRAMISGIGVFYPDRKPTQRIGIVPDVPIQPTIAGIRAGRDEVLEEALRQILGSDVPPADVQNMAKPR
jgi:C-terminal processing protease CtpA/Prc